MRVAHGIWRQNFATIAPYTIEEAYEVAEAIRRNNMDELRDELGDLLLQVVFHSQMACEQNSFTFEDVVATVCEKMIRRHPHVFADSTIETADAQIENWEVIKAAERKKKEADGRILSDVPTALPALMRAQRNYNRAPRVWGSTGPTHRALSLKFVKSWMKFEEAIASGDQKHIAEEIGDLLFAVTNLARFSQSDAETVLRDANQKFIRRFEHVEDGVKASGRDWKETSLDDMETLWIAAKLKEKHS